MRADNYTTDRITNESERCIWIIYSIIVALSSLVGDSIVLYTTIKWNAIKLHRVIVVLIQHLAALDLLLTVFRVIPNIISLFSDRWILGDFLCWLVFNMEWLSYWLTSIFTCCLSTSKLLVVRYPLSSQVFTRRYAHIACFIVWGLALISPPQILFMFFSDEGKLFFDYSMYLCMYDVLPAPGRTMPTFFYVVVVFVGIMQTIMFIVLPLTSILLVFEARRAARRLNERVRWQGVLTVTLCTGIYYVSTLPALLVAGIDSHKSITISVGVRRFCNFLTILNIMTNFFVYCLTVKSYREFLMIRAKRFLVKLGLMSFPSKPIRRVSRPASRTQSSEVDARASVQLTAM